MISCSNQIQDTSCRNPVSGIRYLVSGIQHPVSSIEYSASNIRYPASGIRHRGSSIENPASRIKHPASSIQHPASGFTLLEVLIAMAIMAVVLVSVYRLHSQTLTMTTTNRFYTQAPLLAQSKMAQLEAASSDLVSGDSGDFGDNFPGYAWSVSTEDVSSEALGEAADDLKRIDVTVSLNEFEYTVRLYRLTSE
ncbi:hypothetical protein D1AOALGA4SA_240 [Olavius algarvensis Delta 1 endosymbiont]|nr:hypothetical protein D1AOALGA4SA_240 [Olavius algarvensis Delta 1 endosymbiont]